MSGTALDHALVREYLHDLDAAFAALPAKQARELREQITAHLDDALQPGAGDHEVAAVLRQLGSPADLVAEADRSPAAGTASRRWRFRLPRLGWRRWVPIAAALILAGTGAGYSIAVASAAPLELNGASSWWYAQDSARAVTAMADGRQQTTVPIRPDQQQGFVMTVDNPSNWTQTVLGLPAGYVGPGGPDVQVSVATADPYHGGGVFLPLVYTLPGSIPPHQTRALRVLWTSTACLPRGGAQGTGQLSLRVRVGWFTRTETIDLDQGWYLSGPSQGRCG